MKISVKCDKLINNTRRKIIKNNIFNVEYV